jgi:hypothetical protein
MFHINSEILDVCFIEKTSIQLNLKQDKCVFESVVNLAKPHLSKSQPHKVIRPNSLSIQHALRRQHPVEQLTFFLRLSIQPKNRLINWHFDFRLMIKY